MSSTQLIAFCCDPAVKVFSYGELIDDHVMRGAKRAIFTSNIRVVPVSTEWKAYLAGRILEIEQKDGSWKRVRIGDGVKYMLQHDSGYVLPLLMVKSETAEYFQRMETAVPVPMPTQKVRAPPPLVMKTDRASWPTVKTAKVTKGAKRIMTRRDDDSSDNDAVCNDEGEDPADCDEWKKSRDALSAAVSAMLAKKSRVTFSN